MRRPRASLVAMAVAVLAACGSDAARTSELASSLGTTTTATTTATTAVNTLYGVSPSQVADFVADQPGFDPVLVPTAVAADWTADVTWGFRVVYHSRDGTQTIRLEVVEPNPTLPTDTTTQSFPHFRGDPRSLYQVQNANDPGSQRLLVWIEPEYWPVEDRGGVPYYLTSTGVTDEAFWQIANSLQPVHPS